MASLLGLFKDTLGIDFFNPASQLWGVPSSPALTLPFPPSQLSAAGVAHTCRVTPFISLKEAKKDPLPPCGRRDVVSQPLPLTEWGSGARCCFQRESFWASSFSQHPLCSSSGRRCASTRRMGRSRLRSRIGCVGWESSSGARRLAGPASTASP